MLLAIRETRYISGVLLVMLLSIFIFFLVKFSLIFYANSKMVEKYNSHYIGSVTGSYINNQGNRIIKTDEGWSVELYGNPKNFRVYKSYELRNLSYKKKGIIICYDDHKLNRCLPVYQATKD